MSLILNIKNRFYLYISIDIQLKNLNAMIFLVADDHLTVLSYGYALEASESGRVSARTAEVRHVLSVASEHLNARITRVSDQNEAFTVCGNSARVLQLARIRTLRSELVQKYALSI
jgi:hypothetical protein